MFKVGDKVKVVKLIEPSGSSAPDRYLGKTGIIIRVAQNQRYNIVVKFKNEVFANWAFMPEELEPITDKKYEPTQGNISMMSMSKVISCGGFRKACRDWLDAGYYIQSDIKFSELILVAQTHSGIQCLIDKGFIREVKEEVFYKVGDKFSSPYGGWILNYCGDFEYVLNDDKGNMLATQPMRFECSTNKIPASEFHAWAGNDMVKINL